MVQVGRNRSSNQPIASGRTMRGCDNLISMMPETRTGEGERTPMPSPAAILPPWLSAHKQFRAWVDDGTWERVTTALREQGRKAARVKHRALRGDCRFVSVRLDVSSGTRVLVVATGTINLRGYSPTRVRSQQDLAWRPTFLSRIGGFCRRGEASDSI